MFELVIFEHCFYRLSLAIPVKGSLVDEFVVVASSERRDDCSVMPDSVDVQVVKDWLR